MFARRLNKEGCQYQSLIIRNPKLQTRESANSALPLGARTFRFKCKVVQDPP